jgi:twinkle protein
MDAKELKSKLLSNLESCLTHLYPAGKIDGKRFVIGDVTGSSGKTLQVELEGSKKGLWTDRAVSGSGGDILTLWQEAKAIGSFVETLDDIRRHLGITEVKKINPPKPQGFGANPAAAMLGSDAFNYLLGRGIAPETMLAYRLRKHPTQECIAYRFWTPEGKPAFAKYEDIHRDQDGKKRIFSTPPYATLWGWWRVTPNDRSIIITEGEKDAMTVHQLESGLPVLSMPNGTNGLTWIDNDYEALNQFETIYLITDADTPGDECSEVISKRLGMTRVMRIPVPGGYKDPNELWNSGDESLLDWHTWVTGGKYFVPASIRTPSELRRKVLAVREKQKKQKANNNFIFPSMPFSYRDGETTIVAGEPGHGKSDLLYQTHIHEMKIGEKVFVLSLEIPPEKMLVIMCQQMVGHEPTPEEIDRCLDWLNDRLVFHTGQSARGPDFSMTSEELFADMDYAYKRFGSTRFVIDSLHFLVKKDDYEAQDQFTKTLQKFDLQRGVHTALVAHSNLKGRKDGSIPGRHDVEGSGGMIKPVDNGLTVWRHEEKETKMRENPGDESEGLHDGLIKCWKQRETGDHFTVKLWFDRSSRTFRTRKNDEPMGLLSELSDDAGEDPSNKDLF